MKSTHSSKISLHDIGQEELDKICNNILTLTKCKSAIITITQNNQQILKASSGYDILKQSNEFSVCNYIASNNDFFIINDISKDLRFINSPKFCQKFKNNFYIGKSIQINNEVVGTICVFNKVTPKNESDLKIIIDTFIDLISNLFKNIELTDFESYKKNIEEELYDSTQYLDLALEGAGLGIWDWDLTDNSVNFDKRWAQMLGIDFDTIEMSLSTWESRVHPNDLEKCYADIQAYMDGKTDRYENVHRMRHNDGHWVYILDKGRFSNWDKDGKPTRFTGTHLDVTEAKQRERELDLILSGNKIGIWNFDPQNQKLFWDKSMFNLYDNTEDDFSVSLESWIRRIDIDDQDRFLSSFNNAIQNGEDIQLNFKITSIDKTIKDIGSRAIIEKDEFGKITFIYGVNWDRTLEQKAIEEAEKQIKISEQNAKFASIGELAAGVGHEINNPLSIVKGYVDLIRENFINKDKENVEYFLRINEAINRIINIVKGLRTFSRNDFNETEEFNPIDLVTDSFNLVKDIYQNEQQININLINQITNKNIICNGNLGKFKQILLNILTNAKDALKECNQKDINIELSLKNGQLIIKISDNGKGMSQETQQKIFEPFFTTKGVNEGTGIGLSLVHNYVLEMNGSISYDSKVENGTTATLIFPIKEKILTKENNKTDTNSIKYNISVLLVEDEEYLRDIIALQLKSIGIETVLASNGLEALEILKNKNFDIILTDMKMPKMDGTSFIKAIKSTNDIISKLVVMTGGVNIDFESQDSKISSFIDAYLFKPFNNEELIEVIDKLNTKKVA